MSGRGEINAVPGTKCTDTAAGAFDLAAHVQLSLAFIAAWFLYLMPHMNLLLHRSSEPPDLDHAFAPGGLRALCCCLWQRHPFMAPAPV
eukprot:1476303-Rhodomonas_salina.1